MILIWIVIFFSLSGIIFQDFRSRMVYIFWFPVLIVSFLIIHFQNELPYLIIKKSIFFNLLFLVIQFLVLTIYFSLREKTWINITRDLLGLGDIFFIMSVAFYFSFINFFLFYLSSLIYAIVAWTLWLSITNKKDTRIPLAGLQGVFFIFFVLGDWFYTSISLTSDNWIYNFLQ